MTDTLQAISKATLLHLPKLKELHYQKCFLPTFMKFGYSDFRISSLETIKRTLSEFMDAVRMFGTSEFKFTFAGFQLTSKAKVDGFHFGVQLNETCLCVDDEYAHMKNYHLIDPDAMNFLDAIDYTLLVSYANEEIPSCFAKKFTGLEKVYVTGPRRKASSLLLKVTRLFENLIFV